MSLRPTPNGPPVRRICNRQSRTSTCCPSTPNQPARSARWPHRFGHVAESRPFAHTTRCSRQPRSLRGCRHIRATRPISTESRNLTCGPCRTL